MPIKRSALRALRKDKKRQQRNQAFEAELKTLKKQVLELLAANKQAEAAAALQTAIRRFDQAAARGMIHRNTAARVKSRLTRKVSPAAKKSK
jgi:small subunit ribosomal protein S20